MYMYVVKLASCSSHNLGKYGSETNMKASPLSIRSIRPSLSVLILHARSWKAWNLWQNNFAKKLIGGPTDIAIFGTEVYLVTAAHY